MTRYRIQIAAAYHTDPVQPMFAVTGPMLQPDTPPEIVRSILNGLLEEVLLRLAETKANSLPSLPEKVGGDPLSVARQWFALVEAGKQGARISVWENEQGRHILIRTEKP